MVQRPIANFISSDERFKKLDDFYREQTKDDIKPLISSKLWFDQQSMCLGFHSLVSFRFRKFLQCD